MEDNPVQMGMMAMTVAMNECDRSRPQEAELADYLGKVLARMRGMSGAVEIFKQIALGCNAMISVLDDSAEWREGMSNMANMLFNGINTALVEAGMPAYRKAQFGDPIVDELVVDDEPAGGDLGEAQDPSTPANRLAELASNPDWQVRAAVAQNPSTPEGLLRSLAADPDEGVRSYTARNPHTPEDVHERLASDESEYVRDYLAQNPAISVPMMQRLASDPHWQPRSGVADNPSAPDFLIELLVRDPDERVRAMASKRMPGPAASTSSIYDDDIPF